MATTALPLICPQGHGPGIPGSRFCNWCGTLLVPPLAPGQPTPTASAPPSYLSSLPSVCNLCGGNGVRLALTEDVCAQCGWLRPLLPGYQLDRAVFLWAQDGQAMTTLHNMTSLSAIARSVSDKVGRPWIEATSMPTV